MASTLRSRGITGRKPGQSRGPAYAKKERELGASIRKHETKQLAEYLKTRSSNIDQEIKNIRGRLQVDGNSGALPSRGMQANAPMYGELVHPHGPDQLENGDFRVTGHGSPSKYQVKL